MTIQISRPIIEIVNSDEQYIGFILLTVKGGNHQEKRQIKKDNWPVY
jgi:hypothetical protein